MRCLYCGKQLALFRRLTGSGEFCSDAHKQSYHEEYNRLALTRLIAAQSRTEDLRPLSAGGTREGGNSRALPEARPGTVHQRWGDLSRPARMLEAPPPEPTPPPQQSFIIKKNVPASSKGLQWLDPVVECSALCIELNKPSWDPSFAEEVPKVPPPPQAAVVRLNLLPAPAFSELLIGGDLSCLEPLLSLTAAVKPAPALSVRTQAGLKPRPAVNINPLEFLPALVVNPEPEQTIAEFRLEMVALAAPKLPLLPRGNWNTASRPPRKARPTTIRERVEAVTTPHAPSRTVEVMEPAPVATLAAPDLAEPRSTNRVKLAADKRVWRVDMPTASKPAPPKQTEEPPKPPAESTEKPRPKLPTIPASRRRSSHPIPSILDPNPQSASDQSLWGAIRKYIKR